MIRTENLGRDYGAGRARLTVLNDVNLSIADREFVAITGPSGSGKSTLLGLLAGLDRPTRGRIYADETELTALDEDALSAFRGRRMGFVFQSFQLIQTLTALENVRAPAELMNDPDAAARAEHLLERVGLKDRMAHYPAQLSGGEMQRVAIARACIRNPSILFADEPTGNLDSANGERIIELLVELSGATTLVLVTHNPELAALAARDIRLRDGRIHSIVPGRGRTRAPSTNGKKTATRKTALAPRAKR